MPRHSIGFARGFLGAQLNYVRYFNAPVLALRFLEAQKLDTTDSISRFFGRFVTALHRPRNIRAVRVTAVVESVGDVPRRVGREIGKQVDHFAVTATAIDQSVYGIAPYPTAFAADDAQSAQPGTKIVESDGAVTRHRVTSG